MPRLLTMAFLLAVVVGGCAQQVHPFDEGTAYVSQGKFALALERYDFALQNCHMMDDEVALTLIMKSTCLMQMERFSEALAEAQQARKFAPAGSTHAELVDGLLKKLGDGQTAK